MKSGDKLNVSIKGHNWTILCDKDKEINQLLEAMHEPIDAETLLQANLDRLRENIRDYVKTATDTLKRAMANAAAQIAESFKTMAENLKEETE